MGEDQDNDYGLESGAFEEEGEGQYSEWMERDSQMLSAIMSSAAAKDNSVENDKHGQNKGETNGNENDELFGLDEESSNLAKILIVSKQSGPVIASFFLGLVGTFVNLLFAGRYVPTDGDRSVVFAGVSLANMFVNVTCLSLLIGMSSAVETLGSQHNGAG